MSRLKLFDASQPRAPKDPRPLYRTILRWLSHATRLPYRKPRHARFSNRGHSPNCQRAKRILAIHWPEASPADRTFASLSPGGVKN